MGILKLFRKQSPEDIYDKIADQIILSSLMFPNHSEFIENIDATDKQKTNACAEIAYLLLHILDRQAFEALGPLGRDKVVTEVTHRVISRYCDTVFKKDTPFDIFKDIAFQMLDTFNDRTFLYHKCSSVANKPWAGKGTMVFALSFYIHKALGRTDRDDVDDILCGKKNLEMSDVHDFPQVHHQLEIEIYFLSTLAQWNINKTLKQLK